MWASPTSIALCTPSLHRNMLAHEDVQEPAACDLQLKEQPGSDPESKSVRQPRIRNVILMSKNLGFGLFCPLELEVFKIFRV